MWIWVTGMGQAKGKSRKGGRRQKPRYEKRHRAPVLGWCVHGERMLHCTARQHAQKVWECRRTRKHGRNNARQCQIRMWYTFLLSLSSAQILIGGGVAQYREFVLAYGRRHTCRENKSAQLWRLHNASSPSCTSGWGKEKEREEVFEIEIGWSGGSVRVRFVHQQNNSSFVPASILQIELVRPTSKVGFNEQSRRGERW